MNPFLREDIENTIDEYWRDVHKNKWMKVSKHCVHATREVLFILNRCSDLNILECRACICADDIISWYRIISGMSTVVFECAPCYMALNIVSDDNVILREYVREIRQRSILQEEGLPNY